MNPTTDVILGVGLTAIVGLLAWLLANVNKLLVRQAVNVRAVALDEQTAEKLDQKVAELTSKVEELGNALTDFHVTLAQFVRKGDKE